MRGADDIALVFLAEDVRILALNAAGHGLANEGKRLVAIESAELDDLAVEFESVIGELRVTETDSAGFLVDGLPCRGGAALGRYRDSARQDPKV